MRIALVTLRFDAPGGVETNVREIARGLRRAGDEVTVYASDLFDEGRWERRGDWPAEVDGVPVRRFPVTRRLVPGLTMPLMTGLVDALREDAPELVHAHSHRYGHLLEAASVAGRCRIPFVVSTHYHPADRDEPWTKAHLLRLQDHLFGLTAYRTADALVVESELERRRVAEFAPRDRIERIPPGLDLAAWSNPGDDRLPDGLPDPYLLYAGRIARNKGLELLLEALAGLPAAERPPTVLMGKDWGRRPTLETRARQLGVEDSIRWLGHVPDAGAYRAVMRGARAFVLPSEYEAFGLVLLEAMACGVPVVATAVGGTPEVLEDGRCGELVPYGDPGALAGAIQRAWSRSREVESRIAEGRRRAAGLDWSVAVDAHRTLYGRLIAAG
jgi:glycosyltransferase involved in cell wall biosynthesis